MNEWGTPAHSHLPAHSLTQTMMKERRKLSNRPRRWEIPTSMEQSCWFFPTSNHHRRSGLVVHPVFPGSSSLAAHTQPTVAMLVLFAMGRLLALRRHRGLQLLVASLHHRVLAPNINCPHIMSFGLAPTNQPTNNVGAPPVGYRGRPVPSRSRWWLYISRTTVTVTDVGYHRCFRFCFEATVVPLRRLLRATSMASPRG